MAIFQNYAAFTHTEGLPGWAKNTTRYYGYNSGTCEQAKIVLELLSDVQKVAQTLDAPPVPPAGKSYMVRDCSGIIGGTVLSVTCQFVNGQTVITVSGSTANRVNIKAIAGSGAEWGESDLWYDTIKYSGADPPAVGSYRKTWNFPFKVGRYVITARPNGVNDATKDVTTEYAAFAAGGTVGNVTTTEVNGKTIMELSATTDNEINIQAKAGTGADWGSPSVWYSTTKYSGADPPGSGVYRKTWPFLFVVGQYDIKSRKAGTNDTGVSTNQVFSAVANTPPTDGGGGGTPTTGGNANLDAVLGVPIVYVGRLDIGYNSHPDRWGLELVPNSLFTRNGTQFARVRLTSYYNAPAGGTVIEKFKERYYAPTDIQLIDVECGKPAVLKEYHTNGTGPTSWDDARNFFDLSFEIGFVIN